MMIKRVIKKIFFKENIHFPLAKRSYSQCAEDLLVSYIFSLRGIDKPSYIDIGAHDPYYLSNTAIFYERGSRGINIEANPLLIENFTRERPEDINLNLGIGTEKGSMTFYIMKDPTLSTFSETECKSMIALGKVMDNEIEISTNTLQNILEEYYNGSCPDFMSLDIEGYDYDILKSMDFDTIRPKIICVESAEYSPIGAGKRRDDLISLLEENGYYEYANTNLNAIMVDRNFWFI